MDTKTNKAWAKWRLDNEETLTIRNTEDETLSHVSFKAGADRMRYEAMVNFENSIRSLKARLPKEAWECFSVTEEMIKFNKSLSK